jgi:penicillin-binding protein-related factor A (putative recombinase)
MKKLKAPTEKQIETLILGWLNAQPLCFAFKVNTVGIYDQRKGIFRKNKNPYVIQGTADILGVYRLPLGIGVFFALEVKTPQALKRLHRQNRTTPQHLFLDQVIQSGGYGQFVSSLEEAQAFFHTFLKIG